MISYKEALKQKYERVVGDLVTKMKSDYSKGKIEKEYKGFIDRVSDEECNDLIPVLDNVASKLITDYKLYTKHEYGHMCNVYIVPK